MDPRIMVIGQSPARFADRPFDSSSGDRLVELCGLRVREDLDKYFQLTNLVAKWPGKTSSGKGDHFPTAEARIAAKKILLDEQTQGRPLIFVGKNVASAFTWTNGYRSGRGVVRPHDWAWFVWQEHPAGDHMAVVVPHPSGVSHWWNEPDNRAEAETFWRSLVSPVELVEEGFFA